MVHQERVCSSEHDGHMVSQADSNVEFSFAIKIMSFVFSVIVFGSDRFHDNRFYVIKYFKITVPRKLKFISLSSVTSYYSLVNSNKVYSNKVYSFLFISVPCRSLGELQQGYDRFIGQTCALEAAIPDYSTLCSMVYSWCPEAQDREEESWEEMEKDWTWRAQRCIHWGKKQSNKHHQNF